MGIKTLGLFFGIIAAVHLESTTVLNLPTVEFGNRNSTDQQGQGGNGLQIDLNLGGGGGGRYSSDSRFTGDWTLRNRTGNQRTYHDSDGLRNSTWNWGPSTNSTSGNHRDSDGSGNRTTRHFSWSEGSGASARPTAPSMFTRFAGTITSRDSTTKTTTSRYTWSPTPLKYTWTWSPGSGSTTTRGNLQGSNWTGTGDLRSDFGSISTIRIDLDMGLGVGRTSNSTTSRAPTYNWGTWSSATTGRNQWDQATRGPRNNNQLDSTTASSTTRNNNLSPNFGFSTAKNTPQSSGYNYTTARSNWGIGDGSISNSSSSRSTSGFQWSTRRTTPTTSSWGMRLTTTGKYQWGSSTAKWSNSNGSQNTASATTSRYSWSPVTFRTVSSSSPPRPSWSIATSGLTWGIGAGSSSTNSVSATPRSSLLTSTSRFNGGITAGGSSSTPTSSWLRTTQRNHWGSGSTTSRPSWFPSATSRVTWDAGSSGSLTDSTSRRTTPNFSWGSRSTTTGRYTWGPLTTTRRSDFNPPQNALTSTSRYNGFPATLLPSTTQSYWNSIGTTSRYQWSSIPPTRNHWGSGSSTTRSNWGPPTRRPPSGFTTLGGNNPPLFATTTEPTMYIQPVTDNGIHLVLEEEDYYDDDKVSETRYEYTDMDFNNKQNGTRSESDFEETRYTNTQYGPGPASGHNHHHHHSHNHTSTDHHRGPVRSDQFYHYDRDNTYGYYQGDQVGRLNTEYSPTVIRGSHQQIVFDDRQNYGQQQRPGFYDRNGVWFQERDYYYNGPGQQTVYRDGYRPGGVYQGGYADMPVYAGNLRPVYNGQYGASDRYQYYNMDRPMPRISQNQTTTYQNYGYGVDGNNQQVLVTRVETDSSSSSSNFNRDDFGNPGVVVATSDGSATAQQWSGSNGQNSQTGESDSWTTWWTGNSGGGGVKQNGGKGGGGRTGGTGRNQNQGGQGGGQQQTRNQWQIKNQNGGGGQQQTVHRNQQKRQQQQKRMMMRRQQMMNRRRLSGSGAQRRMATRRFRLQNAARMRGLRLSSRRNAVKARKAVNKRQMMIRRGSGATSWRLVPTWSSGGGGSVKRVKGQGGKAVRNVNNRLALRSQARKPLQFRTVKKTTANPKFKRLSSVGVRNLKLNKSAAGSQSKQGKAVKAIAPQKVRQQNQQRQNRNQPMARA